MHTKILSVKSLVDETKAVAEETISRQNYVSTKKLVDEKLLNREKYLKNVFSNQAHQRLT